MHAVIRRIFLLLMVLASVPARGDLTGGGWRKARPILLPPLTAPRLAYLPLDAETLAAVESVSEYRIVRAGSVEIPYRIIEERGQVETYALETRIVSLSPPGSEPEEMVLDFGARPASRLRIGLHLSGAEFRCRAQVEGSRDRARWHQITDQASLFRQTGGGEQTQIILPRSDDRFLRLRLFRMQGALPLIERVEASSETIIARRLLPVPASLSRQEEAAERRTVLTMDIGRRTRALAEARFDIAEAAFDRPVTVETREPGKEWTYQATGALKRLAAGGAVTLPLDHPQARTLRFSIANGDDTPLTIRSVTLWRVRSGLIFPAAPGQRYELWYGRPDAPAPAYELERLPLTAGPAELARASLGAERALPLPSPVPKRPSPWSERNPWLFWSILAGVVALLLLLIVRSMRGLGGHAAGPGTGGARPVQPEP